MLIDDDITPTLTDITEDLQIFVKKMSNRKNAPKAKCLLAYEVNIEKSKYKILENMCFLKTINSMKKI